MKKISLIFIFIFLTGLFAGFFFSTGISEENSQELSSVLISELTAPSSGFLNTFISSLITNLFPVLIMLPAAVSKILCPLPPLVLWFRSFATGFCCGMIFLSTPNSAFAISAVKILPHNLLLIPGLFLISAALFYWSSNELAKKNRSSNEKKDLSRIMIFSIVLIIAASIIQGVCHSIALSP